MIPDWTIFIVGVLATVLTQIVKWVADRWGKEIKKFWITIIVGVISIVLAAVVLTPKIPIFDDFMFYLQDWVELAGQILVVAMVIYNLFLDKLFDKLNFPRRL